MVWTCERKQPDEWVSACRHIVVESVKGRGRGRPRKTWRECVEEDMSKLKLGVKDTQDREVWRNGILGNRLTRAVARKTTLNDDDDDDVGWVTLPCKIMARPLP